MIMAKTKLVNRNGITNVLLPSGKTYETSKKKLSKVERDVLDALDTLISPLEDRLSAIETKMTELDTQIKEVKLQTDKIKD